MVVSAAVATAAAGSLATELAERGIPVMALKGPPVQQRLFGTDAAYRSADVDLLVRRSHHRRARRFLTSTGWEFLPENGLLWRLDRSAGYRRRGVTVDLHWGLHSRLLSPRALGGLEAAMWQGATRAPEGWTEPRLEPLVVYLALHAAGTEYAREEPLTLLRRAATAADLAEVEALARQIGLWPAVHQALTRTGSGGRDSAEPVLPGPAFGQRMRLRARNIRISTVPASFRSPVRRARSWAVAGKPWLRAAAARVRLLRKH